jgi:uncharacterized protein
LDTEALTKVETWREFDELYTIKVQSKYKSAIKYYNTASCLSLVDQIKVPTLVLHSKDDPIVSYECLPLEECLSNEHVITAVTRKGGHCCYFYDSDGSKRWYTHASSEFLTNALDLMTPTKEV